jgi:iron complex transport system substrate-binding protein
MSSPRSRVRDTLLLIATAAAALGAAGGATAGRPPFPLTLNAANGPVTLAARPVRIVSLSPTATEDLYALDAGTQVVAVDSDSDYPPRAPRTRLSAYTPNVEAIDTYRPDLVIVADDTNNVVAELGKLDIPVLVEPAVANLGGVYAQIDQIARATGHLAAARRLVTSMKRRVAAVLRSLPRPSRPLSVYHELDQTYYSATSRTFIGQLYTLLGLHNIADRAGGSSEYPQLSAEYILDSDPDLIVLADTVCCGQDRATVASRPGWNTIAAVKDGAVVPVNDAVASRWGPRIVLFLQEIAAAVRRLERRPG